MDDFTSKIVYVLTAIVGVAIVAVLVSGNSQTVAVIQSAGNGFASVIKAATGPVSGGLNGTNATLSTATSYIM